VTSIQAVISLAVPVANAIDQFMQSINSIVPNTLTQFKPANSTKNTREKHSRNTDTSPAQ